jgi:hypothetical protein
MLQEELNKNRDRKKNTLKKRLTQRVSLISQKRPRTKGASLKGERGKVEIPGLNAKLEEQSKIY